MRISESPFGTYEGNPVTAYTLCNPAGMQVSVINYGATITRIITADKNNISANVILGFDDLEGYLQNNDQYIGSIVGRYCNRIANGIFILNGEEYHLAKNHNGHHLHGGFKGFDKMWWNIEKNETQNSLKLTYLGRDGEEGFPGNLNVTVIYTLSSDNDLKIEYTATTDKATPVNLTSHCYFNLSGKKGTDILDHELELFAHRYTIIDEYLIPTGEIAGVKNTALDFLHSKKIGKDIAVAGGYDHNLVLDKNDPASDLSRAACVYEPVSGRFMEMFTTEPALQFYSAKFLDPQTNTRYFAACCLEAQHYPNSPNEPSFPDTILKPGEKYRQTTIYKFSVKQ